MKVLAVHPGPLMYSKIYVRLEPLGLELVAQAARQAGHDVQLIDLQAETHAAYFKIVDRWTPDVVAFSCNYLANVPEIVDLAKLTKERRPQSFILVGGHSASFVAHEFLEHGEGAIDCVLKGEGEAAIPQLLLAVAHDRKAATSVPGVVELDGEGPLPALWKAWMIFGRPETCCAIVTSTISASWTLVRRSSSRGAVPWDCSFCSAWTFYGRSYRAASPGKVVEELERIKEPGVFIVDDVAFIQSKHGLDIGEAIARKGIKKRYYLETRGDVLLRNKEVFTFWKQLGLQYMFIGMEAIDEEGLKQHRKRITLGKNFEALDYARSLGIRVAINLIADPDWDKRRFELIREWCLEIPEIVTISVNTPYPGTETWHTESRKVQTRDYRLYDIQHAVLPTKLPLAEFYEELVKTQHVLNRKHLGWAALKSHSHDRTRPPPSGPDQFCQDAVEVQCCAEPETAALRPPATRQISDGAAARAAGDGQPQAPLHPQFARPAWTSHRRRHRTVRGRHPYGYERKECMRK